MAPTTNAPTTDAPTMARWTTDAPTTNAPTTDAPTTMAPTTTESTTPEPTDWYKLTFKLRNVPKLDKSSGSDLYLIMSPSTTERLSIIQNGRRELVREWTSEPERDVPEHGQAEFELIIEAPRTDDKYVVQFWDK